MKRRVQVAAGFVVVAALVGIGAYPVRKGITVRYRPVAARRSKRRAARRRPLRERLLFWW